MRFTFPFNLSFWLGVLYFFLCISESTNAQQPTVRLSVDQLNIIRDGGKATVTATLSEVFDRDVKVYFDFDGSAVYRFDYDVEFSEKGNISVVAGGNGSGSHLNQFSYAHSFFIDKNENIFVSDFYNHRIVKWVKNSSEGVIVAGGNGPGNEMDQLNLPFGIFVDNQDNIFIGDWMNHRVQKWAQGESMGTTVAGGNGPGDSLNQLYHPSEIAVDQNGDLIILNFSNGNLVKWVPGAKESKKIVVNHIYFGQATSLNSIRNFFLDENGNIFLTGGFIDERIFKLRPNSDIAEIVAGWYGNQNSPFSFNSPKGIHVDKGRILVVADANNHRIQQWVLDSSILPKTVAGGNGLGGELNQLSYPNDVQLDRFGNIFILDSGNFRVLKINDQPQILIRAGDLVGKMDVNSIKNNVHDNKVLLLKPQSIINGNIVNIQDSIMIQIGNPPKIPNGIQTNVDFVCPNSTFTYTLPSAEEGATYEWGFLEASPGAKIIATTATSATVFFEAGFSEATLTVLAKNAFGESPKRSFKVRKGTLPNTPGTIQASHLVVCQNSTRSYTVLPVDGALSYEWSYSGTGASFSNGGASIRVSYGASATSGTWQVRAMGGCGSSDPRTLPVQMIPQNQVVQGPLTLRADERRNKQATRSIILQLGASQQPITLEHGTVFSAQLVGCPVE